MLPKRHWIVISRTMLTGGAAEDLSSPPAMGVYNSSWIGSGCRYQFRKPTNFHVGLSMQFIGRPASRLLIWLTAVAMPFQAGWALECGCASAARREATTSFAPAPLGCCCGAAASETSCCKASQPQPTCCGRGSDSERSGGCQCGPTCRCADGDEAPTKPAAPAPDNGRSPSDLKLTFSQVAVADVLVAHDDANAFPAESNSAFYQPGTQICVLLCRFTL